MQHSIFHRLSKFLWALGGAGVVLFAVYVSLGRLLAANLSYFQDEVLAEINARLPFRVEAQSIEADWRSFTPEIALHDLQIILPGSEGVPLQLIGGRIGVDVLDSLSTRSLQFTSLQLEALELKAQLTADGQLLVPGLTNGQGEVGNWLREFLLNIEYLTLRDNRVQITLPSGEQRELALDLQLSREGSSRQLYAALKSDSGTRIHISGKGLGDPFRPASFVGQGYVDIQSDQLDRFRALFPQPPAWWPAGQLASRVWLNWDRGEPSAELELAASELKFAPEGSDISVPLDNLSLQASLQRDHNRWTMFVDSLHAAAGPVQFSLPRLQVDSWDNSLRLRAADIALQPLNELLAQATLPERVAALLQTLGPRGTLTALELDTDDIGEPAQGWLASGNFRGLAVESWHGAPAVTGADGYFEISRSGGSVLLDSRDTSLEFPTVYHAPQHYSELAASIDIGWDEDAVKLHSGLITAVGEEGTVHALFGLTIPLHETEAGIEMDLSVGLRDSVTAYRDKYIPFVLHQSLLDWLHSAIGEGSVSSAGFIWRGSLHAHAAPLRTVQLFMDLAHTNVQYQPDWPMLEDFDGTLIIDDTNVSLWADSARLYDSSFSHLSAETWMDDREHMHLLVDARLDGPASDGLRVVHNSPLREMTGGAFDEWSADGELATRLRLGLDLGHHKVAPDIDLDATVKSLELGIHPGDLALVGVQGKVHYDSVAGFRADDLRGTLWGRPLRASLSQQPDATSPLVVAFRSRVATADLQRWLHLEPLAMANGTAAVSGEIDIARGQPPVLHLASGLEGVALDLPSPWEKPALEKRQLNLSLPLAGGAQELSLDLGDALRLRLGLLDHQLKSAALGLSEPPPALQDGRIRVAGSAALVDVRAWQDFADRYLLAPAAGQGAGAMAAAGTTAGTTAGAGTSPAPAVPSPGLSLDLEDVHAQKLLLWGSSFDQVTFSLHYADDALRADFDSNWASGEYAQGAGEMPRLLLHTVDVSQLLAGRAKAPPTLSADGGPLLDSSEDVLPDLPETAVEVRHLRWHGEDAGKLAFHLEGSRGQFAARDITGDFAGLTLSAEQPGQLRWQTGGESRLTAPLVVGDFGATLEQLGYARTLETDSGRLDLELAWPGSPQAFSMEKLDGTLDIDMASGRFLQNSGGAGALKVVELLNLAGVVQRLSMSHMFESGITFSKMKGKVYFHPGTIELANLTVSGNSSAFAMNGVSNIATRSLSGELVATLPVASNLPWVAALAGGLPVAAGVYVVSKVFEKPLNRLSSGVYHIGGTWDAPEFTFDRIFDDELRLAADAADPNAPAVPATPAVPLAAAGSDTAPQPAPPLPMQPLPDPNQPASDSSRK